MTRLAGKKKVPFTGISKACPLNLHASTIDVHRRTYFRIPQWGVLAGVIFPNQCVIAMNSIDGAQDIAQQTNWKALLMLKFLLDGSRDGI